MKLIATPKGITIIGEKTAPTQLPNHLGDVTIELLKITSAKIKDGEIKIDFKETKNVDIR